MVHAHRPDHNTRDTFDSFMVLGRVDAILLLLALGAFTLADFSQAGSGVRLGLIGIALALVVVGVAVNGIRRAILMRRHQRAIDRSRAHIAEIAWLDEGESSPPTDRA